MQIVSTKNAPQAIGPYSQAIKTDAMVYTSGQVALRADGSFNDGDIAVQTTQVFENLTAVLNEAGSGLDKVVKTTVFLSDMDNFSAMNEVYATYFPENPPARAAVQVARLPKDAIVEIEAIAVTE